MANREYSIICPFLQRTRIDEGLVEVTDCAVDLQEYGLARTYPFCVVFSFAGQHTRRNRLYRKQLKIPELNAIKLLRVIKEL